jgi:hypothetical protein
LSYSRTLTFSPKRRALGRQQHFFAAYSLSKRLTFAAIGACKRDSCFAIPDFSGRTTAVIRFPLRASQCGRQKYELAKAISESSMDTTDLVRATFRR